METIRVATPEEVKSIEGISDITPSSTVLALPKGAQLADLAVIRSCTELDPVLFNEESSPSRRVMFLWGLLNILKTMGQTEVYFNVDAGDAGKEFREFLERTGAEQVSKSPEIRYKKVI